MWGHTHDFAQLRLPKIHTDREGVFVCWPCKDSLAIQPTPPAIDLFAPASGTLLTCVGCCYGCGATQKSPKTKRPKASSLDGGGQGGGKPAVGTVGGSWCVTLLVVPCVSFVPCLRQAPFTFAHAPTLNRGLHNHSSDGDTTRHRSAEEDRRLIEICGKMPGADWCVNMAAVSGAIAPPRPATSCFFRILRSMLRFCCCRCRHVALLPDTHAGTKK